MHSRMKTLVNQNAVSLERLIETRARLGVAKSQVATAEQKLLLTTTHAPSDGTVGIRQVNVGDYVSAGEILATFQPKGDLRVTFSIPEQYSKEVKKGDRIIINTHTIDAHNYQGTVYAVNPAINVDTRTLTLRAHIIGQDLLPGMFAKVTLITGPTMNVIVVPQTAVIRSLHGDYVYKVIQGKARKTIVFPGERRGQLIVVKKGLQPGDIIVSAGQLKIQNGSSVTDKNALVVPYQKSVYHAY